MLLDLHDGIARSGQIREVEALPDHTVEAERFELVEPGTSGREVGRRWRDDEAFGAAFELGAALADPDRADEMDALVERYGEVQARFEELDGYALEGRAREVLDGLSFSQEMMDGDVGAYIRAQIGKANLLAMDKIWDNGFRQITTSTKPINNADDLRGFKIRVPVSPMWTSLFKAFDSAPTSINASEMYTALQTKVVDGQENPYAVISNFKLYEVQKYCSVTNHMWDGFWTLINRRAWDRLPADVQQIAAKHINAAAMAERADLAAQNDKLRKDLEANGMVFNTPKTEGFRDKLRTAGFYKEWQAKFGDEAWSVLEKYTGKLG